MRAFVSLLSSAVLATVVAVAPAAATTEPSVAALPTTTFYDLAVDGTHVYVTGRGTGGVYVRDLTGGAVTHAFPNESARGMALSADGSTLYVALTTAHAVAALSTTTLTETGRWATGAGTCPHDVAELGTQLWFAYGCTNMGDLGVVERSGESPTVTLDRVNVLLAPGTSRLLAAPENRLVVHDDAYDKLYVLTAADGALTQTASRQFGTSLVDFTLSPDGSEVYVAAHGADHAHGAYALPDLTTARGYGSATYPHAIAAGGGVVAATRDTTAADKEVSVFTAAGTFVRTFDLPACCSDTSVPPMALPGGTALSADGATLFLLTQSGYQHGVYLHVLPGAAKGVGTITLTKPASAKIRVAHTITGTLSSGLPIAGPQTLHVSRVSATYGTVALADVTTAADGTFSFADTVRKRGSYTYRVTWDGDAEHLPALGQATLKVLGLTPAVTITTNASSYRWNATAYATGKLGTTYNGDRRTLQITATPYGYSKRTLKTARVDANGYLKASTAVSRKTTFAATFAGDEVYEPRTVTKVVTVGVNIKQILGGYYTTSGSYRVYRKTVDPSLHVEVSPNRRGTCMAFTAQHYTSGAWRTIAYEGCLPLDFYSIQAAVLTGTHAVGVNYRIRSTFAGDVSNARTVGAWQYLRFTN